MNPFELYTMIFYVLDADWDESHDENLGQFLSGMSPFTFSGIGSAVRSEYLGYLDWLNNRSITLENSFALAKEYIMSINDCTVSKAFNWIEEEEWLRATIEYLASDHKGKG